MTSGLLLDTNVVIELLSENELILARFADSALKPAISVVMRIELEGGLSRDRVDAERQKARLDRFLDAMDQIPFTVREAEIYGATVAQLGFSRRKVIDRMIAASAVAKGMMLATCNPRDFRGIDGLEAEGW